MLSIIRKSICCLSMLTRSGATEGMNGRARVMRGVCGLAVCALVALLSSGFIGCQEGSLAPADGFISEQNEDAPPVCVGDFCRIGPTIVCDRAAVGESEDIGGVTYTKRDNGDEHPITAENAATTCTSGITDMSNLFNPGGAFNANPGGTFNEDIGHWDTSDVTQMHSMFHFASEFNQDIGAWDTSNAINMNRMFRNARAFNQDIGGWNTGKVENMDAMFNSAHEFDQDLSGWCVSKISSEPSGFSSSSALDDDDLPVWGATCGLFTRHDNGVTITCDDAEVGDTGIVDGVTYTKRDNGEVYPITAENAATTCTSGITDMSNLFSGESTFNEDISHWDTSSVTTINRMFRNAVVFNQDIGDWDTGQVTDMTATFQSANAFNQYIGGWNTQNVMHMNSMLHRAFVFNQDLSEWCLPHIPQQPNADFAGRSALEPSHYPSWGSNLRAVYPP